MRPGTLLRLALAGSRVDGLRIGLTSLGSALAALALLSAATVAAIGAGDGPYTSDLLNQSGLHPGVVIAFIGLCVPVLILLAQCSRIGAPARDRRLASLRLAGATPSEIARVTTLEAGLGSAIGALVGLAGYFVLRTSSLSTRVPGSGALRLPTDVVLPWWVLMLLVVLIPALVSGATLLALRRVAFTPFGVSRRVRIQPPRVVPLILVAIGVGLFFLVAALSEAISSVPAVLLAVLLLGGFTLAVVGLLSGQGALTQALGRLLVTRTSRPALLLAARRMIADPFAATRATSVLTVAVLVAAGARHLRNATAAQAGAGEPLDPFYGNAYDLVDLVLIVVAVLGALGLLIAAAEGIVARRRTYAAVVAVGTPRGVVARAILAEILLPLVPSLLLATIVGTAAGIGFYGRTAESYDEARQTSVTVTVGLSWSTLALTFLLAMAVTTLMTSVGLLFLRRATEVGELRAAA